MKIIIQKFGGSSLATLELRENIVQKVREAKERSINPVIVVSAMGRKGEPYATDTLIDIDVYKRQLYFFRGIRK